MITWTLAHQRAQRLSGDSTSETLTYLKADINLGARKFNAALNRYFNRRSKTTDIVADQQYYQLPPDCIRVSHVKATVSGGNVYPLRKVVSEDDWDGLNITDQSSNLATYYFVRGRDEIGLYPKPSTNVTDGLIVRYEPRDKDLSVEDYETGTVTVTNGSQTVTHSASGFNTFMANRAFRTTDGSDGQWYVISSATTTTLTLEEPYIGPSGAGKTFTVGETFLFPEEYHDAPIDFALSRFFDGRSEPEKAAYYLRRFENAIVDARERYTSSSQSLIITDEPEGFNPWVLPPGAVTGV